MKYACINILDKIAANALNSIPEKPIYDIPGIAIIRRA